MQHIINVSTVEHQPQWPANDNESQVKPDKSRVRHARFIAGICLLVSAAAAATGCVILMRLVGLL